MSLFRTLLAAILLAVCASHAGWAAAQSTPSSVKDLVARTKAQIRTIDMAAFKSALDKRKAGLVVDVREPGEYASGHVPGAINIPRGVIELNIWPHVGFPDATDLNSKITLYCGSGTRCVLAAKSLQDLGFTNAVAVDMRIADWAKAGYPLVTE
ncbi:MAG TPA: rhodanese-like domain-containing protein [Erythrobacter sp.]